MKKIKFKLLGMDCTSCAINIDGDLEDLNGVTAAATNYAKQFTEVTFNPTLVTVDDMITVIKKIDDKYTVQLLS